MTKGMPGLRFEFIRGPIWAKTRDQIRKVVIEGINPVSKKPVMQEISPRL
jgi:hypothetical protein